MFTNQSKPSWHIQGELRLQRLEADTAAIRKRVDAIYESEMQPLQQRRVDLQHQIQSTTAPHRNKRLDNAARLASLNEELAAVNEGYAQAQSRHSAAQAEARAAIALIERARKAWRNVAGGVGIGFEHKF